MKQTSNMLAQIKLENIVPRCFLLTGLYVLMISTHSLAQSRGSKGWSDITASDFTGNISNPIKGAADAVILEDVGSTTFEGSRNRDWVAYVFRRRVKILLLNQKAFKELGYVSIELNGTDKLQDRLEDLQASTYNLVDGKIHESKLGPGDVYEDRIVTDRVEKKFAMPDLKEGSIIEYSYKITSDYIRNIPSWRFQYVNYPCLYSEFSFSFPSQMVAYLINRHGLDSFSVNTTENKGRVLYKMASVNATDVEKMHKWVMTNLPPLGVRDYVNSAYECLDGLDFYLAQTYNNDRITSYSNSWDELVNGLLEHPKFGALITDYATSNLVNEAEQLTKNVEALQEKIKKVYEFVRDNIETESDRSLLGGGSLYNVLKQRKGSASDVNLLLIALLRQCKIAADPAVLATKDKGFNPSEFAVQEKLNHVVCLTWLYGDTIVLDASEKRMAFGKLPLKCYNGYARIVSTNHSGFIYLYPDNIKEYSMTTIFLSNDEKGKVSGTYENTPGYYGSYEIRSQLLNSSVKDYFDKIRTYAGDSYKISNEGMDSLHDYNNPLRIHYDLTLPDATGSDVIYFNPVLNTDRLKNLFTSETRKFAVQMDYPIDKMYLLNMEVPMGYEIEELPGQVKTALEGGGAFFEYVIAHDSTNIQMRIHLKMLRASFYPEEYRALRDFFALVEKKENEQIVFKKKGSK
jgi:hypothetical protein